MIPATHIVFGGSRGIGFAYAKWQAFRNSPIIIVARNPDGLDLARAQLLACGSPSVDVHSCDLTSPKSRAELLAHLDSTNASSVFIGGPSPPVGDARSITPQRLSAAIQSSLLYPADVLCWIVQRADVFKEHCTTILLSSSATQESTTDHRFFLSSVLRRATEEIATEMMSKAQMSHLEIWRPRIVDTDLARSYALDLIAAAATMHSDPIEILKEHFETSRIPPADEFVEIQMTRHLEARI